MKYYLVAVLSREDNKQLETLQRNLTKKSKNKKAPYMAVVMDSVEDPDLNKLENLLREQLTPFRYFHVEMLGKYINSQEEKVTGLPVVNFGYIKMLQRHLNEYMQLAGFKVKERNDESDFIFSMSSDKLPKVLEQVSPLFEEEDNKNKFMVEKIELWKTMNSKKDSIVLSFPLKNPKIL